MIEFSLFLIIIATLGLLIDYWNVYIKSPIKIISKEDRLIIENTYLRKQNKELLKQVGQKSEYR